MERSTAINWQGHAAILGVAIPIWKMDRPTGRPAVRSRGPARGYAVASFGRLAPAMPMQQADDHHLMAEVANGNEQAFRVLAGRHVGWALRLAGRLIGNHADAEDVVQEAMLRVWTSAPRWRPEARFETWFYRVVVNLVLDGRRRKPLRPLSEAGDPVDPRPDPQEALAQGQAADLVAAAIAELPERQRVAVVLSYYEGASNAEVAALLGVSVGAVEGLLVRARRTLRERLAPMLKD